MSRKSFVSLISLLALAILPLTTASSATDTSPSSNKITSSFEDSQNRQITPSTSSSGSASFGNGVTLKANAWIQPFSNWSGCGQFKTSVVMNASPQKITNTTSFYQIGFGSLSIKGLNIEGSQSAPDTLVWTNTNGANGSYLSGSVCGGWGSIYVGINLSGTAEYNGTVRIASTRI